jgi:hypothetical protein
MFGNVAVEDGMTNESFLSDHDRPLVIETATVLSQECESDLQRLQTLFRFKAFLQRQR